MKLVPGHEHMRKEFDDVLRRALGRPVQAEQITPLTNADDNRAYRVDTPEWSVVVKHPNRLAGASLRPEAEYQIAHRVAEAGLGPRPLGIDAVTGAIVSEYLVDAEPMTDTAVVANTNIERIAASLKALHSLQVHVRPFEPLPWALEYVSGCGGTLTRKESRMADELLGLAARFRSIDAPVLCHNDLVAANVLDDGELWMIDFEYAVSGPPIVDLASLAAMNNLSQQQQRRLIAAYYTSTPPYDSDEFAQAVRLQELLSFFWSAARVGDPGPEESAR